MEKPIYFDIEQNTELWFELRKGRVTASETDKFLSGLNTKGYLGLVDRVAREKLGLEVKKRPILDNIHTRRGKEREPIARALYELQEMEGHQMGNGGIYLLGEYLGASPDGLVFDDGLGEIKCPKDEIYDQYELTGKLPRKYLLQMQMQMFVTGRKWCDFIAYKEHEIYVDRIVLSSFWEKKIIERLEIFKEDVIKQKFELLMAA